MKHKKKILLILLITAILVSAIAFLFIRQSKVQKVVELQKYENESFLIVHPESLRPNRDREKIIFSSDTQPDLMFVELDTSIGNGTTLEKIRENTTTSITGKTLDNVQARYVEYGAIPMLRVSTSNEEATSDIYYTIQDNDTWRIGFRYEAKNTIFTEEIKDKILSSFQPRGQDG